MDSGRIKKLSEKYNRIPVYRELNITMIQLPLILSGLQEEKNFILLESADKATDSGRFTYLCFDPVKIIKAFKDYIVISRNGKSDVIDGYVFDFLNSEIQRYSSPVIEELGSFNGGFAGYISYEAVNDTGILRRPIKLGDGVPVAELALIDDFIVHDNLLKKFYAVTTLYCDDCDLQLKIQNALARLDEIENFMIRLIERSKISYLPLRPFDVTMEFAESDESFLKKVENIKENISDGEIIQGVISRRLEIKEQINPCNFYLKLRDLNPSPYMYFLKFGDTIITGCSPETHFRLKRKRMLLKPIAGTAPLSDNRNDRIITKRELLRDEKEKAEHLMLVDLARNDLGRIAASGSVRVKEFMKTEEYSHVVHIVSSVTGILKDGVSLVDAFKETFPAGTVTGAPKVRAIELIDECEDFERWAYAGAVGYFGFNGCCDTCITLRTAYFNSGRVYTQAGAGIVYDSIAQNELNEIKHKLRALSLSMGYAI